MPEDDDQTTDDQIPEGYVSRENIRDLETQAAEAKALKRENAFLKALGPSDDPRLGYFQKGYEGDLNPDAIRSAAKRDGFLTDPATAPTEVLDQGDLTTHSRIAAASAGVANTGFDWQAEMAKINPMDHDARDRILEVAERAGHYTTRSSQ